MDVETRKKLKTVVVNVLKERGRRLEAELLDFERNGHTGGHARQEDFLYKKEAGLVKLVCFL